MKARRIILWVVGVAIILGGLFLLFREGGLLHCWIEKCYEGKPATYWIDALQDKDPKVAGKAESALFEIAPPSKEAARRLLAQGQADPDPNSLPNTPVEEASPQGPAITLQPARRALVPERKE